MELRKHFMISEVAERLPDDELTPMFPPDVDLQLYLGRSVREQPFFSLDERDTVWVCLAGEGRVEFADGPVRYHTLEVGDFVYVPAGTAHRLVPETPLLYGRFRAARPGVEGVAWYCRGCGRELFRLEWDEEPTAATWTAACTEFSEDERARTCSSCGALHAPVPY